MRPYLTAIIVLALVGASVVSPAGAMDHHARAPGPEAQRLAEVLTSGGPPKKIEAAVRETLSWAGVPSVDSGGRILKGALGEAAPLAVGRADTASMAVGLMRSRRFAPQGLTLAQIERALRRGGIPVRPAEKGTSGLALTLRDWITHSRTQPDAVESFGPLFLQAMSRRRGAAVNLAAPNYSPSAVTFSELEQEVFFAILLRGLRPPDDQGTPTSHSPHQASDDICTEFLDRTGSKTTRDYVGGLIGQAMTDRWLDMLDQKIGTFPADPNGNGSPDSRKMLGKNFGRMMNYLSILEKLARTAYLFNAVQPTIHAIDEIDRPVGSRPKIITFVGEVALGDFNGDAVRRLLGPNFGAIYGQLLGCAKRLKIPMAGIADQTRAEFVETVSKSHVEWDLNARSTIARINYQRTFPGGAGVVGRNSVPVRPTIRKTWASVLWVDVLPEPPELARRGCQDKAFIQATGRVDLSSLPFESFKRLRNAQDLIEALMGTKSAADALSGRLRAAIEEIANEWIRAVVMPTAFGTTLVNYHRPPRPGEIYEPPTTLPHSGRTPPISSSHGQEVDQAGPTDSAVCLGAALSGSITMTTDFDPSEGPDVPHGSLNSVVIFGGAAPRIQNGVPIYDATVTHQEVHYGTIVPCLTSTTITLSGRVSYRLSLGPSGYDLDLYEERVSGSSTHTESGSGCTGGNSTTVVTSGAGAPRVAGDARQLTQRHLTGTQNRRTVGELTTIRWDLNLQ